MKCSNCHQRCRANVSETREIDGVIYRRRFCGKCGTFFVSREDAPQGLKMPSYPRSARKSRANSVEQPTPNNQGRHLDGFWSK